MSRNQTFSLAMAALLVTTVSIQAQTADANTPVTTFKANARTVIVDVVVTDHDQAVTGLHQPDFKVFEDGKPQAISYFEEHRGGPITAAGDSAAVPAPALPANTFTNVPTVAPTDSVNVLLMDVLNTPMADQIYVRKEMVKYLETIPPGIRLGVFLLSTRLQFIQGVTTDSSALLAAIAGSRMNASQSPLISTPEELALVKVGAGQVRSMQGTPEAVAALTGFQSEQDEMASINRTSTTLQAFQQMARYLAGIPGRKNLMWFSGSFPLCITNKNFSETSCPYPAEVEKTVNLLAKAQVSLYPFRAEGLAPDSLYDASAPPNHNLDANFNGATDVSPAKAAQQSQIETLQTESVVRAGNRDTMDQLARYTGGQPYYLNDFKAGLEQGINNGSRYYTVAYTPTNKSENGKHRSINVQLSQGKNQLAYRRGYYEDTPKELKAAAAAPAKDSLRPLMDRGMPNFAEVSYTMHVQQASTPQAAGASRAGDNAKLTGPTTRYGVDLLIQTRGLSLDTGADSLHHGLVEVSLVAYDHDGRPLNWMTRILKLDLKPASFAIAEQRGVPAHLDIDLPAGEVYLRSGIFDTTSNKAGTIEIPVSRLTIAAK